MTGLPQTWRPESSRRIVNTAPSAVGEQTNPGPADVDAAAARIAPFVLRTGVIKLPLAGAHVAAKLECRQRTGSFKIRGAANRLLTLSEEARRVGVVTASSGNHGRAIAEVAGRLGMRAVVCVPRSVDRVKLEAIRESGAEVRKDAETYDHAVLVAERLVASEGLTFVHAFDDPEVIAGQGTLAIELLADAGELDAVLVPLSGGGLASGVALAVKARSPETKVIGVSASHAAVLHAALLAGRPVEVAEQPTLAGALSGGLGEENHNSLRLVHALLDEALVVGESEIAAAMRWARAELGLTVEGGGAVPLAAVLGGGATVVARRWGPNLGIVLTGGNVDPAVMERVARG